MNPLESERFELLIVGFGNTLRGDDGAGPRIAEIIGNRQFPRVRTLACAMLTPELAEPVSQASIVLFVDAAVDTPDEVRLRSVEPAGDSQVMTHAADPSLILALARDLFGHAPDAWCVTIPATQFEFGEQLSARTQRAFVEALEKIEELCRPLIELPEN